jgi:hypothetical protein
LFALDECVLMSLDWDECMVSFLTYMFHIPFVLFLDDGLGEAEQYQA